MFMIKIKKINNNQVVLNGNTFETFEETRGKREKFWIGGLYSNRKRDFLVKIDRNETSCESFGEVLFSELCKMVNFPCVNYHLVKVENEYGEITDGVACENYNTSDKDMEISGFNLGHTYSFLQYDNQNGKKIDPQNNIDFYLKAIKYLGPDIQEENLTIIRNDMLKLALMDFLTLQGDRHWYNISFSMNCLFGENSLSLTKAYDNGSCFLLNRGIKKIQDYSEQFLRCKNIGNLIEDYTLTKMPLLGISTTTSKLDEEKDGMKVLIGTRSKEDYLNFKKELAHEILTNPEIYNFYIKLKQNLNVKQAVDNLNKKGDIIPECVSNVASIILKSKFSTLDKTIKNLKIENARSTDEISFKI